MQTLVQNVQKEMVLYGVMVTVFGPTTSAFSQEVVLNTVMKILQYFAKY